MRQFDHPNMDGFTCPICGTAEDKPVTLIGIDGTQEGHIMQAKQVHMECLNLTITRRYSNILIFQYVKEPV
jgi:hypothetical protein